MSFYMIVLVLCLAVFVVLPATNPTYGNKTKPAIQCVSGCSCLAGLPGIPGLHGKPGAPGRDGREGIQGKRGPRGFDGNPGKQGLPESPGTTGKRGARGPEGAKGDTDPKGAKGEPGPRGISSFSNWKECSWKPFSGDQDNGPIKDCVFQKKYNDSVLHVYWNGDFRINNCDTCCKRWFFTFNGAECKAPGPIDGTLFIWKGRGTQNIHRVRHIEGHCDKINKGQVRVGFNVGNCVGYGNADASTGWGGNSRLFVEEVPRPQP